MSSIVVVVVQSVLTLYIRFYLLCLNTGSNVVFTEDSECTILDCLYNNEQEVYYIIDILCWKGVRYYKQEVSLFICWWLNVRQHLQ